MNSVDMMRNPLLINTPNDNQLNRRNCLKVGCSSLCQIMDQAEALLSDSLSQ